MKFKFYCRNLFFIFFISFFSCSDSNNSVESSKQDIIDSSNLGVNVIIDRVNDSIFYKQLMANGKVSANQKSELRFKLPNMISIVNYINGQKLVKGDVIAVLENDLMNAQLEKSKIELKKADNKFQEEKINYGKSSLTKSTIERLKVKSGLLEAKNNLEKAKIEFNRTILKAPFSGIIANIEKKQGDYITTSDVFCTLINPDNLEVSFSVLENEFDFVFKGQQIKVQSFSNKEKNYDGKITEINPIVDKNGLIKIKAKIQSKSANLLDGMHVKVFINKALEGVIVIPKEALVLRSNREVVFTYENGRAKWNYVELAGENSTSYALKKGLKVSDTLIVSGNLNLAHDAKVNATFVSDEKSQK